MVRQLFEHRTYICLFFFILMSKFRVSELVKSPIINQVLLHFLYVEIHLIYAIIILGNVININDLVYRGSFSLFLVRVQRLSFILFLWSCVQALSKISICKSKLRLRVPEHSIWMWIVLKRLEIGHWALSVVLLVEGHKLVICSHRIKYIVFIFLCVHLLRINAFQSLFHIDSLGFIC